MSANTRSGADAFVDTLAHAGVTHVFGVPGTQNVSLFEALRRSAIRTILTTSELGAAFAAVGYARASGDLGVLVTIPGPGFAYALPGVAEARADSAAILHVTGPPASAPGKRFTLQAIDQEAIAKPLVKAVHTATSRAEVTPAARAAIAECRSGEPGPVLLQLSGAALAAEGEDASMAAPGPSATSIPLDELRQRVQRARRPVVLLGQGAVASAAAVRRLLESHRVPALTTPSGRGCVPEDHPLSFGFDALAQSVATANALLREADLVLVLGCKLGHNGTAGFQLDLPADKLVHVDTSADVLNANYPASLAIHAPVQSVIDALLESPMPSRWTDQELHEWRGRMRDIRPPDMPEPVVAGASARTFFEAMRGALPRDALVVTDSGLHQILTRRYYSAWSASGLMFPSDFQSMGFGLPGAIGAAFAAGKRPVVAIVGDGGMLMTGMELTTAVRERLPLTVIVFNDGQLNQIRLQQLGEYGHAHGVTVGHLDLEAFAAAAGARFARIEDDIAGVVRAAMGASAPTLIEVIVGDSTAIRTRAVASRVRETVRRTIGRRLWDWLKRR